MNRAEFFQDIKRSKLVDVIRHWNFWLAYFLVGTSIVVTPRGRLVLVYHSPNGHKFLGLTIDYKDNKNLQKNWKSYMEKMSYGMAISLYERKFGGRYCKGKLNKRAIREIGKIVEGK